VIASAVAAIAGWLHGLDTRFLVPALVLQTAVLGFRAVAWRNILACACRREIPVFTVACAYASGVALNGFLPARGGEAAKVALVRARVPGTKVPTIAGSLSVVCLLDGVIAASLVAALWSSGAIDSLPLPPFPDLPHSLTLLAGLFAIAALVVSLAAGRFSLRIRPVLSSAMDGLRILRSPGRLLLTVLPFILAGWACRIAAIYFALQAFHIDASPGIAALVVVLSGASAAVPLPGGGGSQQAFATYALHGSVSTAGAMSFSFGVQLGVTVLNSVVGLVAAMVLFRTLRPGAALRAVRTRSA
jgi:uncharacterized membrane protein YbhN (UPF0104 family)